MHIIIFILHLIEQGTVSINSDTIVCMSVPQIPLTHLMTLINLQNPANPLCLVSYGAISECGTVHAQFTNVCINVYIQTYL